MSFIDSYKRLEKLCSEIYNDNHGITSYIDEMIRNPIGSRFVPGWDEDFKRLMQSPWGILRNVPEPEAYLNWHLDKIIAFSQLLQVGGINLPYWLLTDELASAFRENGIFFSVWTVNEADRMERCIRLGAGNITTRTVRLALETREKCLRSAAERT